MSKSIERFRELTMLDGTSGFESEISKYLEENLSKYADEIKFDNLGGIYAIKKSKKENAKTVMIAAHMDEVGFIVTKVLPNGMLKFETLGGFREDVLLAQTFFYPLVEFLFTCEYCEEEYEEDEPEEAQK